MNTLNNGNILIEGKDLTPEQVESLPFRGAKIIGSEWIHCHSFWFKDGKPSTDEEYQYPVCNSLKFLPY